MRRTRTVAEKSFLDHEVPKISKDEEEMKQNIAKDIDRNWCRLKIEISIALLQIRSETQRISSLLVYDNTFCIFLWWQCILSHLTIKPLEGTMNMN